MRPTAAVSAGTAMAVLREAYEAWREGFDTLTARGRARFVRRDWQGTRADTVARLGLHASAVSAAQSGLRATLGEEAGARSLWLRLKREWAGAILDAPDRELAQTFFNSVSRRVGPRRGVDPAYDSCPTTSTRRGASRAPRCCAATTAR